MELVNVHCHALYGVDDGAESEEVMYSMLDAMYDDGIRCVCLTPHYNPGHFPPLTEVKLAHAEKAKRYAEAKHPDMKVLLGAELYWHNDAVKALTSGECFTLNGTRRVLVEFSPYNDPQEIRRGVTNLLTSGFVPVIAHIERYAALCRDTAKIKELRDLGAYIQVNTSSIVGKHGFFMKHTVFSLIKAGLVDIVADDSHDMKNRAPGLSKACGIIRRKFGDEVAEDLFVNYPLRVIN